MRKVVIEKPGLAGDARAGLGEHKTEASRRTAQRIRAAMLLMRECRRSHRVRLLLLLGAVLLGAPTAAAGRRLLQEEDVASSDHAREYCVNADFPLEFKHAVDFNVNEGIGPFKDDSTNLECHCENHSCGCRADGEDDCDEYSQGWFLLLAYAHQTGIFLYDLPKYNKKYHLDSMVVWG